MDIQWDKKYLVNHPRIDHEHQVFVELIRAVALACDDNPPKEKALRLLMEVQKYAEFHFVSEENIMIDADYPEVQQHQSEHRRLLSTLDNELHQFRADRIALSHISNFLFEWFALHTTRVDMRLTQFLAEQSASGGGGSAH